MLNKNFILATLISTLLTACGGGGGTSSNSTSTTQTASAGTTQPTTTTSSTAASSAYTGKKTLATVNADNQKTLVYYMYSARIEMVESATIKPYNDIIQTSLLNQDISCVSGGTIRINGSLTEILNTGKGTIQVIENQCNNSGNISSGTKTIKIDRFDIATKKIINYTITYNNFIETYKGQTTTTDGTRNIVNGSSYTEITSTASQKISSSSGSAQILENGLKLRATNPSSSTVDISLTGQMCEGINGCVNISTPVPFLSYLNASSYEQGQSILTGYANSKTRLETVGGINWISLDANGDGVYETTTRY